MGDVEESRWLPQCCGSLSQTAPPRRTIFARAPCLMPSLGCWARFDIDPKQLRGRDARAPTVGVGVLAAIGGATDFVAAPDSFEPDREARAFRTVRGGSTSGHFSALPDDACMFAE